MERADVRSGTAGVALVVEDDWLLRQSLADDLTSGGWTVLEAESGETALAEMRKEPTGINLLVTDIRLAGQLNGWDVAETMRQNNANLAVIYVSANPPLASRQVAGSVFLSKPYMSFELLAACRALSAPKSH
jgi:DNA-binding response OmpR family regulator